MAVDITAAVIAGTILPRIQLNVTIANPAQVIGWNVSRADPGGTTVMIYIGTTSSGAFSLIDDTAPLGEPVVYWLYVTYADYTNASDSSAAVTITGTSGCFLTNPRTGLTLPIELHAWPQREREARQAILEVLNRPDPIGLTDTHTTPAGTWTLYTATDTARDLLTGLLISGAVVILRTQPASSIPAVTALVGKIIEKRWTGTGGDQRRSFQVAIQEIAAPPATALPLNATLGGLAIVEPDNLGDLSQLRPTLQQLSQIVTG
jgi:hypothetical protein